MIYRSESPVQTKETASIVAGKAVESKMRNAIVVALEGELGAGKTTFVQGFARALGIKSKIKSPTFVLIKKYLVPQNTQYTIPNIRYLFHIDCYRLKDYRDLLPLGIKEILKNSENIVLIEWSDRVKKILPINHIKIHIDHINKNTRRIKII